MPQPDSQPAPTAKLVRFHQLGNANVLQLEDLPLPEPGPGEVRLRVKAIGLNRAECVFRKGQYLDQPILPSGLGYEASGFVEAVGPQVDPALVGQIRSTVPRLPHEPVRRLRRGRHRARASSRRLSRVALV